MNKLKKKSNQHKTPCLTCHLFNTFEEKVNCCGCSKYFEWKKKEEERRWKNANSN